MPHRLQRGADLLGHQRALRGAVLPGDLLRPQGPDEEGEQRHIIVTFRDLMTPCDAGEHAGGGRHVRVPGDLPGPHQAVVVVPVRVPQPQVSSDWWRVELC